MLRYATIWGVWLAGCTPDTVRPKHVVPGPAVQDTAAVDTAASTDTGSPDTGSPDTGQSDTGEEDTGEPDTATPPPPPCAPPIVLSGSGFIAPDEAWWISLLEVLGCRGGEVGGEPTLEVVLLTESSEGGGMMHDELEEALFTAGFDEVIPVRAGTPEEAAAAAEIVATADAVVLAPTSAGDAYDAWNDTALEDALGALYTERSGGIGGVGEGAMLLAGTSLAGGQDYLSTHVMIDGHTTELDDASDGGSALHTDFLPLIPDAIVDVQMTALGRLVRLVGAMARQADEVPEGRVWGVGLDTHSGLVIQDGLAQVVGPGTVSIIRTTDDSVLGRAHWTPLTWTALELDRLTAGWRFDLESGAVDTDDPPPDAETVLVDWVVPSMPEADWHLSGHLTDEEAGFGTVITRSTSTFETATGTADVTIPGLLGMLDADFFEVQAINHEAMYRALYEHIGHIGVLVTYQGRLEHHADAPGLLRFTWNTPVPSRVDPDMLLERWEPTHVVLDSSLVTWRSLSTETSVHSSAIHPTGLIGLRLHLLAGSDSDGWVYDLTTHAPARP